MKNILVNLLASLDKNALSRIVEKRSNYEKDLVEQFKLGQKEIEITNISKEKGLSNFGDLSFKSIDGKSELIVEVKKGNLRVNLKRLAELYTSNCNKIDNFLLLFIKKTKKSIKLYLIEMKGLIELFNLNSNSYDDIKEFNKKYMSNISNIEKNTCYIEFIVCLRMLDIKRIQFKSIELK